MNIQLRFFASIREALGLSHETVALPPGRSLRMACNQVMADEATPLSEGCEVAFFPPVTGG